jgi:hypothetical protein
MAAMVSVGVFYAEIPVIVYSSTMAGNRPETSGSDRSL